MSKSIRKPLLYFEHFEFSCPDKRGLGYYRKMFEGSSYNLQKPLKDEFFLKF